MKNFQTWLLANGIKLRDLYDRGKKIAEDASDLFERGRKLVQG